jgi:hypothetical protein
MLAHKMQDYSDSELEEFGVYLLARFFLSRGDPAYMQRPVKDLVKEGLDRWKDKKSVEDKEPKRRS